MLKKFVSVLPYVVTFIAVWVFCSVVYGDVFTRAQQDSYVSGNAITMKFLLDQDWGQVFWFGRYLLLVFKNVALGGFLMASLLTLSVWAFDRFLCVPRWLHGLSACLPFALLWWMVSRGLSLFYKNEGSVIVLYPLFLSLLTLVLAAMTAGVRRWAKGKTPLQAAVTTASSNPIEPVATKTEGKGHASRKTGHGVKKTTRPAAQDNVHSFRTIWKALPWGLLMPVACFTLLTVHTLSANENEILTCRMQNRVLTGDMDEIARLVDDGLEAKQPTRSVAAYYAVGLVHTDQILERLFEIPFKYPEMRLDVKDGSEEYGIMEADCNFFSGLMNASYRASMDHTVMNGPHLYHLKRMALCALMNNEQVLAEKYFTLIDEMPFEHDFVERYRPMLQDRKLLEQDPMLARVLKLKPEEEKFEQQYRRPVFMGYHIGLMTGSNEAIFPSLAACLYSKDLPNAFQRAQVVKGLGRPLPACVQEAMVIYALKNPQVYSAFPELASGASGLGGSASATVQSFITDIQKFYQEKYDNNGNWKEEMSKGIKGGIPVEVRDHLEANWLGHYVYYYYCENVRVKQTDDNKNRSGVN